MRRQFVQALGEKGLSSGYIRRVLASGARALNRAAQQGEITWVPRIDLRLAPEGEPRDRVLTLAEMGRLFAQAEHEHLIMFLTLAVGTAARPNAILSLTDAQIDTRRGIIPLQPVGVARTKKRNPTLPIPQPLRAVLHGLPPGPVVSYFGRHVRDIGRALSRLPDKQRGPRRFQRGPRFTWWSQ